MAAHDGPPERRLYDLGPLERAALSERIARGLELESGPIFAYVFGSFAEGRRFHDIDVGVHFGGLPGREAERCADAAAERLAPLVPFPLDIVALDARPAAFKFHVYRGQLLLARDDDFLTAELERTMRVYFDIEPVLRQATAEAFSE